MSKVSPITTRLRDGRVVLIREARVADAPGLAALLRAIASERAFTLFVPEEIEPVLARQAKRIRALRARTDALRLVAIAVHPALPPAVVGDIDITGLQLVRCAHVARLGIDIASDYRGVGLGHALMTAAMAWAQHKTTLSRIELYVYADNAPAIALYRRHGFVIEGTRRRAMQFAPGDFRDDYLMARLLLPGT